MWCYRRVLHVLWTEKRINQWVLEKIGCRRMLSKSIAVRKPKFIGHVVRQNGLEKEILTGKVEG